jgi:hypothetical protein
MKQQWEISGRKVDSKSKLSVQFHVKNAEDGHVAFRVARATKKKPPEVVIFSGKNSSNRGSPLLKRVIEKDKQKIKDLGFKDDKPGWRKLLSENTEPDFYTNFVEHALKMVR